MALKSILGEIPLGGRGLTKWNNRTQHQPGDLSEANSITLEDTSIRKEAGATLFDPNGVTGSPTFNGTLAASATWNATIAALAGSAIAPGGTTVSGVKTAIDLNIVLIVPVGGYAAGSTLIVSGHGLLPPSLVSDNKGNTYTQAVTGSAFVVATGIWYSVLTNPLLAGDLVTVSFPTAFEAVGIMANFTGLTGVLRRTGQQGDVGTNVTVRTNGTVIVPSLVVAAVAATSTAASSTPLLGFTELADVATATSFRGNLNYRIDTTSPSIIAMYDWASDVKTTPAGTVTTVAGSPNVTGVGTTFTAHAPGDTIVIANETRTILSITNNTALITTEAWVSSNAGVAYDRIVGNRLITATESGNIFKDKPTSLTQTDLDATTLASGLSLTARPGRFVAGGKEAAALNRKLFYFNGVDRVKVLSGDGTSVTNIANPPADWPLATDPGRQPINGTIHNNRLFAWGNKNDPHRVYVSDPDDHENFVSANAFSLRFASNLGDRIYCGTDYQGVLIFWKYPRGILYLDDTDLTTTNWFLRTKSEALGCAPSPYAVLPIDEDVLFMAADGGIHLLSAVDTFGGLRASNLGHPLGFSNWIQANVNLARLDRIVSTWYPEKRIAYFGVPSVGSDVNDLTLKFDFSGTTASKPVVFTPSTRDGVDAFALKRFSDTIYRPIFAESGFVYLMERETRAKDTQFYESSFRIVDEDFAFLDPTLRYKRKTWEHLAILMEPGASNNVGLLTVSVYVDGNLRQSFTYHPTQRYERKKLNVGDGYDISVKVECVRESVEANPDMALLRIGVWFNVGNEDQSR